MSTADQVLEAALVDVTERFGIDPLAEPARATALVADLIASAGSNTGSAVISLRQVLQELSNKPAGPINADDVTRAAIDRGALKEVAASITRIATDVLGLELTEEGQRFTDDEGDRQEPKPSRFLRTALLTIVALAVIAVGTFLAIELLGGGQDTAAIVSDDDAQQSENGDFEDEAGEVEEPSDTATAPTREASPSGFTVTFPPVAEGDFLVDRGWRVTPDGNELIGIVRLTSGGTNAASGLHQELVPGIAGDGTSITWNPAPATAINRVARFNVSLDNPNSVLEIEFRTPISTQSELTEADLLNLFEEWSQEIEDLRPLGASDELLEPVIAPVDG